MPTVPTAKLLLLKSTTKSVESGTYDVICQFCTVKDMVVESEVLKAQNCALSKFSLPVHSNVSSENPLDTELSLLNVLTILTHEIAQKMHLNVKKMKTITTNCIKRQKRSTLRFSSYVRNCEYTLFGRRTAKLILLGA